MGFMYKNGFGTLFYSGPKWKTVRICINRGMVEEIVILIHLWNVFQFCLKEIKPMLFDLEGSL